MLSEVNVKQNLYKSLNYYLQRYFCNWTYQKKKEREKKKENILITGWNLEYVFKSKSLGADSSMF